MHHTLQHALALGTCLLASSNLCAAPQDERGPLRFGDTSEHAYTIPFFPGANYDPGVPTPASVYGSRAGDRLAHHDEIVACFEAWAAASDRVVLRRHGQTHEGRDLVHALVTSPANHARLDEILADHAKLDDPRPHDAAALDALVEELPAVAWMGYSIHGDEVSGCDAAIALGYHLAASTDAEVTQLLDEVLVVIDPNLNPDGRERIVGMVEQATGRAPVLDHASMHRGRWPFGRGNHYLFDMNRDWMAGTQPETRARWEIARRYHPQLFVDAHEMGALDTYLFYPQAEPLNPHVPAGLGDWQRRYAEDAAAVFDALGWSYYTREWADGWAPFYSDAWGSLYGAVGMLYEQASARGIPLRKASGRVEPYRETVHHQVAASWANLRTLRANRVAALRDQLAFARASVDSSAEGNARALALRPTGNEDREARMLTILRGQGMESFLATRDFTGSGVLNWDGSREDSAAFPAGTLIVPVAQPRGAMVRSYLSFDVRMSDESLQRERETLERTGSSNIYDMTSWSLPLAFGLDATWIDLPTEAGLVRTESAERTLRVVEAPEGASVVGFVVDGRNDASLAFAVRALEDDLYVEFAEQPFRVGRVEVARGSLLVPVSENRVRMGDVADPIAALRARVVGHAEAARVDFVYVASTGLADPVDPETGEIDHDEPDFGGGHFDELVRPRVAILSNAPTRSDTFGHLWWWLDHEWGISASQLDVQSFGFYDLRRFDVLVAPPGSVRASMKDALEGWVRGGGTLIAMGSSATSLTQGELALSQVVLRRHALEDLEAIETHVDREIAARDVTIDAAEVWGDAREEASTEEASDEEAEEAEPPFADEDADRWARRFAPRGAHVRAYADPHHWLTVGTVREASPELPIHVNGSSVFLTKPGVDAALRLADEPTLRVSGLVWPEARQRLARSAWATTESVGSGQVILFADVPGFRGYHALSARLFGNAVVYGASLGASQPVPR